MSKSPSVLEETCSVRSYSGEHVRHDHAHVQIMFALRGRMELEVAGRCAFSDTSCGVIIPAGTVHAFMAPRDVRMLVIDAPAQAGVDRMRRFAVTATLRHSAGTLDAARCLGEITGAPDVLARRGVDLSRLDGVLDRSLHESWPTARMAALFFLSPQRFHARLTELTGLTPQTYLRMRRLDAAQKMLRRGVGLEATALHTGYRSASALAFALRRDRQLGARQLRDS